MTGIPVANRHFGHDHMGYQAMDWEVYYWLIDFVGQGNREGGWTPDCEWLWCWNGKNFQQAIVVIPDPDKALLFKLTWGGE